MTVTRCGSGWPLLARERELAVLREALTVSRGVVISGAAGVGKSRLLEEAAAAADALGREVVRVRATPSAARIALGAFAVVLEPGVSQSLVRARQRLRGAVVCVDDAHALDDASAALLLQLAQETSVFVTVRQGEPAPEAIHALWKDELCGFFSLEPFTLQETEDALTAVLRGPLDGRSAYALWDLTGGNPLFLRELCMSGMETKALRRRDGLWQWHGGFGGVRVAELVRSQLNALDPLAGATLELLAASGTPVDLAWLSEAELDGLRALTTRGLADLGEHGRRRRAELVHPVYSEVVRAELPAPRLEALGLRLASAVEAAGARRRGDTIRIAGWRMRTCEPALLERAADDALSELAPGRAAQFARAALQAGGGFRAHLAHARALASTGAPQEAENLLATLVPTDAEERAALAAARARNLFWALGRADEAHALLEDSPEHHALRARFALAQGDPAAAITAALAAADPPPTRLLGATPPSPTVATREGPAASAAPTCPPGATLPSSTAAAPTRLPGAAPASSPAAHGTPSVATRLSAPATAGAPHGAGPAPTRPPDAAPPCGHDTGGASPSGAGVPVLPPAAAAALAEALAICGDCDQAVAVAGAHEPDPSPLRTRQLAGAQALAHLLAGRLEAATAEAERAYNTVIDRDATPGTAIAALQLGHVWLSRGQVATAQRWFNESAALLREADPVSMRPSALAGIVQAAAHAGDAEHALAALAELDAAPPTHRLACEELGLARAWAAAASGDRARAGAVAQEVATAAEARGAFGLAARAWHEVARLGAPERAAPRLAALAGLGPWASPSAAGTSLRGAAATPTAAETTLRGAGASPTAAGTTLRAAVGGAVAAAASLPRPRVGGPFVRVAATHAFALTLGNAPALLEAAERFERLGALLLAAEAAQQAATAYTAGGRDASARMAARRAVHLHARCAGAAALPSPELEELTPREQEIARLAARLTSKEIAEQLVLSVRTVDNHLQRVYRKLGIVRREQLAGLI